MIMWSYSRGISVRTLSNGITSKAEGTLGFFFFLLHLTQHVMCEHIIFFPIYIYIYIHFFFLYIYTFFFLYIYFFYIYIYFFIYIYTFLFSLYIHFFTIYIYIYIYIFFCPLSAGCKNSCQSTRRNPGPKV